MIELTNRNPNSGRHTDDDVKIFYRQYMRGISVLQNLRSDMKDAELMYCLADSRATVTRASAQKA